MAVVVMVVDMVVDMAVDMEVAEKDITMITINAVGDLTLSTMAAGIVIAIVITTMGTIATIAILGMVAVATLDMVVVEEDTTIMIGLMTMVVMVEEETMADMMEWVMAGVVVTMAIDSVMGLKMKIMEEVTEVTSLVVAVITIDTTANFIKSVEHVSFL